ncbi:MAG: MaoC family dehydratase [Pseudohongiella sp.]|jgi:acyl dehydratase|nr:MaoC family dehydratase [Pseudohongiella sp.]
MTGHVSPDAARALIGTETGISQWHTISQKQVDQFAETTGDFQFIHLDVERAKNETPFGGTIAHGYLTLSLLSMLGAEAGSVRLENTRITINYGLDKVRFLNPVRVGARIRARFVLLSIEEKNPGQFLLKNQATVEIEGQDKPAMIAESLSLAITTPAA